MEIAREFTARRVEILVGAQGDDSMVARSIDVDGDGINESVYLNDFGSLIIDRAPGPRPLFAPPGAIYDNLEFWGEERSLIRHRGTVYVMTSGGAAPALFRHNRDGTVEMVCAFRQTGKRFEALTPHEIYLARSKAQNIDPVMLAIKHRDIGAVRMLVRFGHDLNRDRGADRHSYLAEAIHMHGALPEAESFIAALLDLGASPGSKSDKNYTSPMYQAVVARNPGIVKLLIDHGAYIHSPYHNPIKGIADGIENRSVREATILAAVSRRQVIDGDALSYALKDSAGAHFLKELVDTGFPLEGDSVWWVNGQRSANHPLIIDLARAREDNGEALALIQRLRRNGPVPGESVGIGFWYETPTRIVHIARVASTRPIPPYSAANEKEIMNFATSICMHLIGEGCGSDAMKQDAAKWLGELPAGCPPEVADKFDPPVCKLAVYGHRVGNYGIYMRDKSKPVPRKEIGTIRAIGAYSELGTRSLLAP